jgi:hypothetical protein
MVHLPLNVWLGFLGERGASGTVILIVIDVTVARGINGSL